jgi:hypothetical protein
MAERDWRRAGRAGAYSLLAVICLLSGLVLSSSPKYGQLAAGSQFVLAACWGTAAWFAWRAR